MYSVKSSLVLQLVVLVAASHLISSHGNGETNLPVPGRRSRVAIEGMVYCKSCSYLNFNTLLNATVLPGAVVKVTCTSTKAPLYLNGTTDSHGYFFIQVPRVKLGTWTSHKCEVSLVSSPLSWCSKPTNLNNGQVGADLAFEKVYTGKDPLVVFKAGPFTFSPTNATACPKY